MTMSSIAAFLAMQTAERGAARNSMIAYEGDIEDYLEFLAARRRDELSATNADIRDYLAGLDRRGFKASSAARRLSAVRQFHAFLLPTGCDRMTPRRWSLVRSEGGRCRKSCRSRRSNGCWT